MITGAMIDTHCHLSLLSDNSLDKLKGVASDKDIFLDIGVDLGDLSRRQCLEDKLLPAAVYFTAGQHPAPERYASERELLSYLENAVTQKILGVGEIGLDITAALSIKDQVPLFLFQLRFAQSYNLPVIIHCRGAFKELTALLQDEKREISGVVHCFTGTKPEAQSLWEMGLCTGFCGNITYKHSENIQETAAICPPDKLLVETDSPFLSPIPLRGSPNRPQNVLITSKYIDDLRTSTSSAQQLSLANFQRIFLGH